VTLADGRSWYEHAWGGSLPEGPGLDSTGILAAASEGRMHGLVLLGADPLSDFPDRSLAKRGIDGAGFVVAVDCFLTESSRRADVVLPAAAYAERAGTFTNIEGRVSRLGQKITPPGVASPDWIIASELAARLGVDLGFGSLDEIWDEIERVAPSPAGVTRSVLTARRAKDGVVVPLGDSSFGPEPGTGRPGGGPALIDAASDAGGGGEQSVPAPIDPVADPGIGSVESHGIPATAIDASEAPEAGVELDNPPSRPPLVRFAGTPGGSSLPKLDSYSLRLIASRTLWDTGTLVAHSPHLAGLHPEQRLRVNPYDLDRLGLTSGDRVRAISAQADLVLDVVADSGVPKGTASLTFGLPGDGPAELIDARALVADMRLETV
jgi:NADH-quinone oxidoreductase subunit G